MEVRFLSCTAFSYANTMLLNLAWPLARSPGFSGMPNIVFKYKSCRASRALVAPHPHRIHEHHIPSSLCSAVHARYAHWFLHQSNVSLFPSQILLPDQALIMCQTLWSHLRTDLFYFRTYQDDSIWFRCLVWPFSLHKLPMACQWNLMPLCCLGGTSLVFGYL